MFFDLYEPGKAPVKENSTLEKPAKRALKKLSENEGEDEAAISDVYYKLFEAGLKTRMNANDPSGSDKLLSVAPLESKTTEKFDFSKEPELFYAAGPTLPSKNQVLLSFLFFLCYVLDLLDTSRLSTFSLFFFCLIFYLIILKRESQLHTSYHAPAFATVP